MNSHNSYPTTPRTPAVKPTAPIRNLSTQKSHRKQPSRNNKRGKKRVASSSEEIESDFSEDDYE